MATPQSDVYTITIRKVICTQARILVTAPNTEAALMAAEDPDDLQPRFKTEWKRVHYSITPKTGGSKL